MGTNHLVSARNLPYITTAFLGLWALLQLIP
jgi:hypothetical protein